jgi:ATP-dependent RNA helicase DeaD
VNPESFDDLGLPIEIVEALLAEGAEVPTSLQAAAIPVIARGNSAVLVAGPGAGTLWAWSTPLAARLAEDPVPGALLVLTQSPAAADAIAEAIGRVAQPLGIRVVGSGAGWVLPDLAHIHVLSAREAAERLGRSRLDLGNVRAVVVDAGASVEALEPAGRVLQAVAADAQRIVVALPLSEAVQSFVDQHLKRAVHIPPRPTEAGDVESVQRGGIEVVEVEDDRDAEAVRVVARKLESTDHVAVHLRSEDAAADFADRLAVRGIASGRPGDPDAPVWLVLDALASREELRGSESGFVVVSHDVPADEDELDRRHSGAPGVVLALPRELPHLHAIARRAGYTLSAAERPTPPGSGIDDTVADLEAAFDEEDVGAYLALLEPVFRKHGAARVAAAAVARLRRRRPATPDHPTGVRSAADQGGGDDAWVRLFVSLGSRDGMRVGDLVGAIVGESGIPGEAVGKIDLRDTFSRVEIARAHADTVIREVNGTTIRGRSVRVDLDRSERGSGGGGRPERGGGRGRPGGGGRPSSGGRPGGSGPRRRD